METKRSERHEKATKPESTGDLISLVQHQINNPLAVVLGNVQFILLKNLDLDQGLIERLQVVEKAALKIAEVNKKLSDISLEVDNK